MSNGAKVAFACAFGALLGSIIGLQSGVWLGLHKVLACVIGFITGGALGWLTYDIKEVALAFGRAYHNLRGRQPDWEFWGFYLKILPFTLVIMLTAILLFIVATTLREYDSTSTSGWLEQSYALFLQTMGHSRFMFVIVFFGAVFLTFDQLTDVYFTRQNRTLQPAREVAAMQLRDRMKAALWFNPISVPFLVAAALTLGPIYLLYKVAVNISVIASGFWKAVVLLAQVCWQTYRYTHSELRATCFIDGGLGAAAGVWFGNPIVGLLIGLGFGLVNYYVVSPFLGIRRANA